MIVYISRFVLCACTLLLMTLLVQAGEPVAPASTDDLSARKDISKLSHLQGENLLFTVYRDAGVFDLYLGDRLLEDGRVFINGESTLDGAEYKSKRGQGLTAEKTLGELEVKTTFALHDKEWLGITLTVTNRGDNPKAVTDIRFLESGIPSLFRSKDIAALRFFCDSMNSPSEFPSSLSVEKQEYSGYGVGLLLLPAEPEVWSIAWRSTQVWSNRIKVNGSSSVWSASVDLKVTPCTIRPGETVTFDECLVSGSFSFTESLLALRSFVEERKTSSRAENSHGFVLKSDLVPALDDKRALDAAFALSRWKEGAPFVSTFILEEGWYSDVGKWSFHDGFLEGKDSWPRQITRMKATPGVKLSPFRVRALLQKERGYSRLTFTSEAASIPAVTIPEVPLAAAEEDDSTDTATTDVLCDPTEPVFLTQLCKQIEELRRQGVRCFETRGLFSDSLMETPYPAFKNPGVTSRASLRTAYEAMRSAMGSDSLWISDEPVTAATAGLVDVFLLSPEAPRRWQDVQAVVKRSAGRFWMNGSPGRVCQGHLRLAGTVLSGEAKGGFTYDEARSWCTYLVMIGGPVYWSDDPSRTAPEILTLVARTFEHSGGTPGVPLDLDRNDLPNLWVRQEKDSVYIALFNWSDEPRELSINYRQEKALARSILLTDILTGETQRVETGVLKVTLRPHQSFCAQILRQRRLF